MNDELTPPFTDTISLSDNRVVVTFDETGGAAIQVGPKVTAGSLYAIASGIEHGRLILVTGLNTPHAVIIDIAPDGEPMARGGKDVQWWDMFAAASVLRLQADIRMSKAIMAAEARAASLGIVVPDGRS